MKVIIILLVSFLSFNIYSSISEYQINKEHSKIQFQIEYMSLTKVQGIFKDYQAKFEFDNSTNVLKKVEATIFPSSIDTSDPKRDYHLKGHEFFFIANYPAMKFASVEPMQLKLKSKSVFKGMIEIRGIKKEVIGDIIYKGSILDPWGKENLFFEISLELNRQDFGMKWNKELDQGGYLVGDKVNVALNIQAQKSGEKTAFSTHMIPSTKAIIERNQLKKGKLKKLSTSTDPNENK
jgi:polyisoprenoid-binding protein YceI